MSLYVGGHNFNVLLNLLDDTQYRVATTHRMPYLYRSFSAKEPYNQWLFPATSHILCIFATLYMIICYTTVVEVWMMFMVSFAKELCQDRPLLWKTPVLEGSIDDIYEDIYVHTYVTYICICIAIFPYTDM